MNLGHLILALIFSNLHPRPKEIKEINFRALLDDVIGNVTLVDLDKMERDSEEESNIQKLLF